MVSSEQLKIYIRLVNECKRKFACVVPEGWQKDYLLCLVRSVISLKRSILFVDTYRHFLRYLDLNFYRDVKKALEYDPIKEFNKLVIEHENLINDTFLFTE